ncbi:MAG: VWA domain-containing protein [Nanoarchaeota archaeon]|nr:VWA domain-containing protein [Nanoarchaeota archaeon]
MGFIEFGNIKFLWIGILLIGSLLLVYYFKFKKKKFVSYELSTTKILQKTIDKKTIKENIISIFMLLALFSLFISLADPMMRLSGEKEGVNVVLVIDSSGSMQAQDFKPDRMASAKESAIKFIEQLETKDNVGVVSFSDSTRIVSFLTNDKDRAIEKTQSIKAGGGTAIGDGLAMGVDMVTSIPNKKKLVIFLSDGEQTAGQISIDDAILYANSEEVIVYTIGVGSNENVVLGYDWFGRPQYAKLDEASLKKIAENTKGEYFRATDSLSLNEIYDKLPEKIKKEKELQSISTWFVWLSITLILGSFVLKYWKRVKVW